MAKLDKIVNVVLCLVAAALTIWIVLIFADANINHYTAYMDADVAGETLLAKACWENGGWQPDTWFMSTGREIFAAARLAPFIYPYVGNDLNLSMGIACTIMVIALIGCMLFFNFEIGLTLKESLVMLILSLTLAVPAGSIHKMLYLYGVMYLGLFITMFFVMAVYARSLRLKKLSLLSIIALALTVVNGLQGMHASVFIFMPLLGTEILRRLVLFLQKKKDEARFVTVSVIVYAVTALACAIFLGTHMYSDTSRNLRHAPEKFLQEVWPSFTEVFQINRMQPLIIVFIILAVAGVILSIKHFLDTPNLWGAAVIPIEIAVVMISTTFSTVEVAPRYFLPLIFLVAVGLALLSHYSKSWIAAIVAALVIVFGADSGMLFDQVLIKNDASDSSTYMEMARWMQDNGYEYGYSNFAHASTMTVVANEAVKIRQLDKFEELNAMKWLSDATWYPPIKNDQGPTCYVVSKPRLEEFDVFLKNNDPTIVEQKEFGDFVVFVLDKDYTHLDM
ncbi:hypothetical protein D6855_12745 [Butyrivibrio sp. CB08]|uniref:hypothetical protein n=1 Tax=Butyrivibrio sp. CB08 TaxID=2364879 RepID=UPI000EAA2EC4|nr:hypothetical protein [Butyrivibrio sp. CB08]RKM57911.1 hypothetical protein D6855_12745 [Butyrivibrio sp. CB08]